MSELAMDSPNILPFSGTITDYKPPTYSRLIVRRPYRVLDDESKEKFESAVKKMKERPVDHHADNYDLLTSLHKAYFSFPEAHFAPFHRDMPNPRSKKFEPFIGKNLSSSGSSLPAATAILPATLAETVKFYVTRPPATSTEKKETEDNETMLNFYVEYDETKNIRFDAYLNENKDADSLEVEMAEYAGSFINFARPHRGSEQTKTTTWSLEIAEVLQDLALSGENKIPVTLVPKCSGDVVTVKSADITG